MDGLAFFIFIVLAWGVLSFGAVYPWAYGPLLAGCTAIGIAGSTSDARDIGGLRPKGLMIALAILGLAVVVQLVPLPRPALATISPATDAFLLRYDVGYVAAVQARGVPRHPLSLRPDATERALMFLAALSLFLIGTVRVLSRRRLVAIVTALLVLGALIGLEGIIQRATGTMKLYGFWVPQAVVYPFGPFVDRNHFAGWMVMTLFLALGYFWAQVDAKVGDVPRGLRRRVLWLSSPDANRLMLTAIAILVMALALLMTVSRSGVGCFIAALLLGGGFVARKKGGIRRTALLVSAGSLVLLAVAFAGLDPIVGRFATAHETGMSGRLTAWGDAMGIIRDFPVFGTGLNAFGTAMLLYQRPGQQVFWQEAHNDYIHLAAEGGILLGVPIVASLALFVIQVRRRFKESADDPTTYWIRVGAVTALLAIAIQELADFSLQIPGNAALFAVIAAIAMHRPARRVASPRRSSSGQSETGQTGAASAAGDARS